MGPAVEALSCGLDGTRDCSLWDKASNSHACCPERRWGIPKICDTNMIQKERGTMENNWRVESGWVFFKRCAAWVPVSPEKMSLVHMLPLMDEFAHNSRCRWIIRLEQRSGHVRSCCFHPYYKVVCHRPAPPPPPPHNVRDGADICIYAVNAFYL